MPIKNFIKKISNIPDLDIYPEGIIIININNEIIGWNIKSEEIFGYLESEIIGRNIGIILDTDTEKILVSINEKTSRIINAKNREGKDILIEASCGYFSKDGKIIITAKDVTKSQKVIEKLLLEYEKVSKVAQNKSGFISAHSNELKTPVHSIIGFSQGLLDGVCGHIDEKQEKYISIINKNANNLLALIDNMIILSKIEADQIKLEYKAFDIIDLIESVKNDVNHLIEEKNIEFNIDYISLERRTIYSDEAILRQILINLFTNAVKFTEAGQVKVNLIHPDTETVQSTGIKTVPYFTNKSYIMFSVSDTGIGISEEDKAIIFSEYNPACKTMTKKYGGTGLGLAITKKLTTILGGSIWVNSKPSQGSTFKFIIPVERILTTLLPQSE